MAAQLQCHTRPLLPPDFPMWQHSCNVIQVDVIQGHTGPPVFLCDSTAAMSYRCTQAPLFPYVVAQLQCHTGECHTGAHRPPSFPMWQHSCNVIQVHTSPPISLCDSTAAMSYRWMSYRWYTSLPIALCCMDSCNVIQVVHKPPNCPMWQHSCNVIQVQHKPPNCPMWQHSCNVIQVQHHTVAMPCQH